MDDARLGHRARRHLGGTSDDPRTRARAVESEDPQSKSWTAEAAILASEAMAEVDCNTGLKSAQGPQGFYNILSRPTAWQQWQDAVFLHRNRPPATLAIAIFRDWYEKLLQMQAAQGAVPWPRECTDSHPAYEKMRAASASLARRARVSAPRRPMRIPPIQPPEPVHPEQWLEPGAKRRQLKKGGRVEKLVESWGLEEHQGATITFERAIKACQAKTGSRVDPPPDLVERLVQKDELNTALRSAGDHYYLIGAGFYTHGEIASSMGVARDSALRPAIRDAIAAGEITEIQACEALGEGFHVDVVVAILRMLIAEGGFPPGDWPMVGTAFSGFDMLGAAMERVYGEEWTPAFASELDEHRRCVLRRFLGAHVLLTMIEDSTSEEAVSQPRVDIFAMGSPCQAFSIYNTVPCPIKRARALALADRALDYVRRARPRIVIVENVDTPSIVEPMWAMLRAIPGYVWEGSRTDPREVAEMPTARVRYYWVGRCHRGPEGLWGVETLPDDAELYPWMC